MNYVCKPVKGPDLIRRWESLEQMCDHGVSLLRGGTFRADALEFQVMGCEVSRVHAYMDAAHPDVPFRTVAPRRLTKKLQTM